MTDPESQHDTESSVRGTLPSGANSSSAQLAETLPDGITAITVTSYKVGPYNYGRLADAMAEHHRQQTTGR